MVFEPLKDGFVMAGLNLFRPEMVVVPMSAKTRDADADSILCSADDAVITFGVVLKAEHESGQGLWIHVWQLIWPDSLDDVTG